MLERNEHPGETWSEYYYGKMELIWRYGLTDEQAVSCIIDGIGNGIIQNGAQAGRYKNPESLYTEFLGTLPVLERHDTLW